MPASLWLRWDVSTETPLFGAHSMALSNGDLGPMWNRCDGRQPTASASAVALVSRHPWPPDVCFFPRVLDSGARTCKNAAKPWKSWHFLRCRARRHTSPGKVPDADIFPAMRQAGFGPSAGRILIHWSATAFHASSAQFLGSTPDRRRRDCRRRFPTSLGPCEAVAPRALALSAERHDGQPNGGVRPVNKPCQPNRPANRHRDRRPNG
jgi:hypothetical protein